MILFTLSGIPYAGAYMASTKDAKRYKVNYKAEMEAIDLYRRLSEAETNSHLKEIYLKLIETEKKHADFWKDKMTDAKIKIPECRSTLKSRAFGWFAAKLGPAFILPTIASIEKAAAAGYSGQKDAESVHMPSDEKSHARIFRYLSGSSSGDGLQGSELARFEGRHKATGGNALRAAVLGANDGLVSVFCLVMGVAGAGLSSTQILVTGLAGLLAGALSMALGEWLSVQSSRELYQHQIDIEQGELSEIPDEEKEELSLIFQAKGIEAATADALADKLISDPKTALDTLVREELGIDPEELGGSAWVAAITSFFLFAVGAVIPVVPYVFFTGYAGIAVSSVSSVIGLFVIGAFITIMTGKHPVKAGLRQVTFGLATAVVTFGIGKLLGTVIV
jgi:VIT1/CCC1 family predicted Fe2+/Mn2+ transporter